MSAIETIQKSLEKLESRIAEAKKSLHQYEGREQELKKRLKEELGIKSLDEAKKELKRLDQLLEEQEDVIIKRFNEFKEKYDL